MFRTYIRLGCISGTVRFFAICLILYIAVPSIAQEATQEAVEPCVVTTETARTIQIRVGPGENRSVYAFLPENQEFEVFGQATMPDETQWWKLDRTEVAPKKLADQAWIFVDDVTAFGDCDAVPEAPPPPIISSTSGPLAKMITDADPTLCAGASSQEIATQSWNADLPTVLACVKNLQAWQSEASEQQLQRLQDKVCNVEPSPDELDLYFKSNWAVTDLAIGYYNLGIALEKDGQPTLAQSAFKIVVNSYPCAWAWDPRGWFWSLKDGAEERLV